MPRAITAMPVDDRVGFPAWRTVPPVAVSTFGPAAQSGVTRDPRINLTAVGGVVLRDTALMVLPVYSAVFGTIVAFGVPRGSLVRHFAYGVLLPVFAYGLAGTLPGAASDVLGSAAQE